MAAEKQAILNRQNSAANTPESFGFTAPLTGFGSKITAVNVANDTQLERSYKAYIVLASDTASVALVPSRVVNRNTSDQPPELIGQIIPPGGTVQFESNFATSLAFTVSVRDLD